MSFEVDADLLTTPSDLETGALIEAGWIEHIDAALVGSRARGCVIGMDLGGTKLSGALADATGTTLAMLANLVLIAQLSSMQLSACPVRSTGLGGLDCPPT